jgi:hypothetical protein
VATASTILDHSRSSEHSARAPHCTQNAWRVEFACPQASHDRVIAVATRGMAISASALLLRRSKLVSWSNIVPVACTAPPTPGIAPSRGTALHAAVNAVRAPWRPRAQMHARWQL